VKFKNLSIN